MVLPFKEADLPYCLPDLVRCPERLLLGTEDVIRGNEHVYRHVLDGGKRHFRRLPVGPILDVLWSKLLEPLLDSVLKHVL